MDIVLTVFIGTFAIVITFGLAVAVHEFGHMFFALMRGVGVESFAIGMGPIIGWKHPENGRPVALKWYWRGIEFSLRWLPIGGFVKLKGPEKPKPAETEAAAQEKKGDKSLTEASYDDFYVLANENTLTKLLVFGGGVFMNFLTAIAATTVLLWIGLEVQRVPFVVENVTPGTPMAERDLLRAGDVVTAMDGASTRYYAQFTNAADKKFEQAAAAPSAEPRIDFTLDVENDGQARRVEFSGVSREEFGRLFDTEKSLVLRLPAVIGGIGPNQPADKAGLEAGDRIVEIDGKPTETWAQMAEIIRAKAGEPCVLTYERNGERKTIEITPVRNPLDENNAGMIGVTNGGLETEIIHPFGFFEALVKAPVATAAATVNLVVVQARFIARATLSELGRGAGGPIAIAVLTTRSAKLGFRSWLDWFITLNLLLLILNILPIPVLDGGFILLAFVEAAIRRPVPPKILQPIYAVFVCLFIGLILFVSALDIRNWFF